MASDTMTGGQMAGDKMAGGNEMKSGGDKTKINVDVDVTIDVIQWSMGGGSAMQNVAAPAMAAGMTHQVRPERTVYFQILSSSLYHVAGDSGRYRREGLHSQLDNGRRWRYGSVQFPLHEPYPHPIDIPTSLCQDGWWKGLRLHAQSH